MDNIIDFRKNFNKLKNEILFKDCFHSDEKCNNIIKSHSIQNNRILSRLCTDKLGEIFSFMNLDINDKNEFIMSNIGRQKASTFTGFCQHHDNEIFKPIELKDFEVNNKEQEYVFAYRSIAWSLYAKKVEYLTYSRFYDFFKNDDEKNIEKYFRIRPPYSIEWKENNSRAFKQKKKGAFTTISELEVIQKAMNINLDKQRFYKIITDIIIFEKETPIASSSIIYVEYDLNGNLINDYCNSNKKLSPLFFTIFPQNGNTFVLLSYLKNDKNIFSFIKEQILTSSLNKQKIIITNLIFNNIENFYTSLKYWESLNSEKRKILTKIYNKTIGQINKELIINEESNYFI